MTRRKEFVPLSLNGDLRRGGWLLSGLVQGDTDAVSAGLNLRELGKSLSDFTDLVPREWFNAHVLANPDFSFDRYASQASWQAGTADRFLSGLDIQDLSFSVVASPSNPHEATSWRFSQMISHILTKHCNIIFDPTGAAGAPDGIASMDLDLTNSTQFSTVGDRFIVGHSENLWSTLQKIGGGEEGGGEFYRIWCDRRNVIHYYQAPPFISPQPASKGTLTKEHIRGTVQVKFHNTQPGQKVGQVQIVAGINPNTIFNAQYPASPLQGKVVRKQSGIWAQSQGRANTLAERLYRWLTRQYTLTVEVDSGLALFGDDGLGLDLGDRVLVTYNGPAEDADTGAGVHLNLSAQSLFVYGVQVNFDAGRRSATATLTCEHDNS